MSRVAASRDPARGIDLTVRTFGRRDRLRRRSGTADDHCRSRELSTLDGLSSECPSARRATRLAEVCQSSAMRQLSGTAALVCCLGLCACGSAQPSASSGPRPQDGTPVAETPAVTPRTELESPQTLTLRLPSTAMVERSGQLEAEASGGGRVVFHSRVVPHSRTPAICTVPGGSRNREMSRKRVIRKTVSFWAPGLCEIEAAAMPVRQTREVSGVTEIVDFEQSRTTVEFVTVRGNGRRAKADIPKKARPGLLKQARRAAAGRQEGRPRDIEVVKTIYGRTVGEAEPPALTTPVYVLAMRGRFKGEVVCSPPRGDRCPTGRFPVLEVELSAAGLKTMGAETLH